MTELGYEDFRSPGFEAFRKDGQEMKFFWWSSDENAAQQNVARSSLAIRTPAGTTDHIALVEFPSEKQPRRPWAEVEAELRTYLSKGSVDESPLTQ